MLWRLEDSFYQHDSTSKGDRYERLRVCSFVRGFNEPIQSLRFAHLIDILIPGYLGVVESDFH